MTKVVFFTMVIFSLNLASCKKEFKCDCVTTKTIYMSNEPSTSKSTDTYTYKTKKKEEARTACINEHNVDPGPVTQEQVNNSTLIVRTECDIQ